MFDSSTNSTGPRFPKKCDRLECERRKPEIPVCPLNYKSEPGNVLDVRNLFCWLSQVEAAEDHVISRDIWTKKTRSHVVFRSLCWKLNSSPCVRFRFCQNMQRNYFVYIYIWRFNIYLLIYCTYEIHYELLIIAVPIKFYWILYLEIFHLLFLKCVTKRQYSLLKHADKQRLKKKKRECLCWAINCRFDKKFFSDKT